jgi:hypothetical protein
MKTKTKRILLAILGGWLAVILIFTIPSAIALRRETRNAEGAFRQYTDALVQGQFDKAYEVAGPDFRSQVTAAQFSQQQEQLQERFGRLLSVKQQAWKVSSTGQPEFWTARFSADFFYEKSPRRFEFAFRKDGARWVLYGYEETGSVHAQ